MSARGIPLEVIVIPNKSNPCWRELAVGKKLIQTQTLGLQMILKRVHRSTSATPNEAALLTAIDELHAFFVKYEKMLTEEIKSL